MDYHRYGGNPTEEKIAELKEMAAEKDLSVWHFKATNTFRIMDKQSNRMVQGKLSFEDAWAFVVECDW